jgi:hypothetical protein
MAGEGREETAQEAPPVDQPTEDSPALSFEPEPQVVDTTAVEEPVEQAGGPEPSFTPPPPPAPEPEPSEPSPSDDPGHPEFAVLGAFAGAFVFAQVLKRLGGRNE